MTAIALVVLTAAVWVLADASGLFGFLGQRVGGRRPWQWFLIVAVAAPVGLPLYLLERRRTMRRHRRWEQGTLELFEPGPVGDLLDEVVDDPAPSPPAVVDLRPPPPPSDDARDHRHPAAVGARPRRWLEEHLRRR